MIKNKIIKKNNLYKGVTLAFAGILATSFFPVNIIQSNADCLLGGVGSEAIILNNAQSVANKGSTYQIRAAYFGSDSQIPVGLDNYGAEYLVSYDGANTIDAITSNVTVTYKSSGQEVEIAKAQDSTIISALSIDSASAVYGTVELKNAGEYVVTYEFDVTVNGEVKSFASEYIVYSEITTAYFEFNDNDEKIVPNVYDVTLQGDTLKNIELPLPTLFDRNEEEVSGVSYVLNTDSVPSEGEFVKISVSGGEKAVVVEQNETGYYIDSKYFNPNDENFFAGYGNYTISYDYYLAGQFITSIKKSFTVSQNYYKNYELALTQNSSLSSAVTGVGVTLPTISGQTGEDSTPAKESVGISYTIEAYRRDSNNSYSETKAGSIVDGVFTPWANGSYRIVYTAKDFYGNTKTLEFRIDGVTDSKAPTVYMYDASQKLSEDEDGNKIYPDASTALKSKTSVGNVIIYAISALDNVSSLDNISLTRVIKNSSREITIDNQHNDKNLIFDYNWSTFLSNNNYIREKLEDLDIDTSSQQEVETWLKNNNFLIVSNKVEDKDKEGYAYLDITVSGTNILPGSSSGTSYTVLYYAKDEAENESTELSYSISIVSGTGLEDDVPPEITFVTNLKNSYRANSIISFEAPTATDDNDTRMDVVTEYFYTGANDTVYDSIILDDENYKIDLSEINNAIYSEDVPTMVTIKVSAKDDYGNVGTWTKEIAIADVQDTKAPKIILEKYNTQNDQPIQQNSEIILPTIVLSDDNVKYINSEVFVNRVEYVENSEGVKTKVETPITVVGKTEVKDVLSQRYTLEAGKVIASYAGVYQVKVVITDAGNNQITTFYNFEVIGSGVIEDPVITGLPAVIGDEGKAEVGTAIDLGTPSVAYKLSGDQYDIFGASNDDSNSAFDYNIKVIGDAPSSYKFNENEENTFTAYEPGIYRLQYTVNVSVFDTSLFEKNTTNTAVIEKSTDNKVTAFSDGNFVMVSSTTKTVKYAIKTDSQYLIYDLSEKITGFEEGLGQYIESNGVKYYLSTANGLGFIARNGAELKFTLTSEESNNLTIGDAPADTLASSSTLNLDAYRAYSLTSNIYTLTVSDTTAPVILTEYNYPKSVTKGTTISIEQVEATDASIKGINRESSYAIIQYKGGETSFSTQYYLNRWTQADGYNPETGNIEYTLSRDGNYTITYYVYDYYNNVNSQKSYSIAVGDTESPVVEVADDFVQDKYELGATLTLDISKITISDNKTEDALLWDTLEIKVTNTTSGSEPLENLGNASENRFSYKLDTAGTYKIEISITDQAGWTTTKTIEFEVSTEAEGGVDVYEIVGIILIVVAVLVLAGVIAYFVINKIKKNKKSKGKNNKKDKNDKIVK